MNRPSVRAALVCITALGLLLSGCCNERTSSNADPAPATTVAGPSASEINLRSSDTAPSLRIHGANRAFEVRRSDGSGESLAARLSLGSEKVTVVTPAGAEQAKIKRHDGGLKVSDPSGATVLYRLKPKGSDYRLVAGDDTLLYRFKRESYGYKVTDAQDTVLFKLKQQGSVVVDGPDGVKRFTVEGLREALAACPLVAESVPEGIRAGMTLALAKL